MTTPLQRPRFATTSVTCPTLLRRTLIWCIGLQRLLLPLEHFEYLGYNIFGDTDEQSTFAQAVMQCSPSEQRSMPGNGMHAAAVGSTLMFLLAGAERIEHAQ